MFEYLLTETGIVTLALAGAVGQIVRAGLGVKKALDEGQEISWKKFSSSVIYGAVAGAFVGMLASDWRIAFTSGLAATDLTETLIKIVRK